MTIKFAVIGDPIAHSLSPAMQNAALKELDPEAEYQVSGFEGSFYGDELMQAGLVTSDEACGVSNTGVPQGDYQSRVFYLKKL